MSSHKQWVWVWGGFAVLFAGCRAQRVDAAVEEYRADVEATLAAVKGLAAAVEAVPALSPASQRPPPEPLAIDVDPSRVNTLVVYAADLADPTQAAAVDARTGHANVLSTCAAIVKTKALPTSARDLDEEDVHRLVRPCARPTYVLVVREREKRRATVNAETRTFIPARYRGEVLAFRLADKTYLGGYGFEATNEDREDVTEDAPDRIEKYASESEIERKVHERAVLALEKETAKAFPGSLPSVYTGD